ncbi:hypothetical protein EDD21DRAFT_390711 [Dissophora ornata]|nr:hypothetical protein EDD21DRAFT_390711 [Dissophora ornata]
MDYITWAAQDVVVDGKVTEHVSFKSFVMDFGFGDKEVAVVQYKLLLDSTRLNKSRRERLRDSFDDFEKAHLNQFWLEWDEKQASKEFDVSCDAVAKRTATLAQKASLAFSARGLSAAAAKNGAGSKARRDTAVLEDYDDVPSSSSENEKPRGMNARFRENVNDGSHMEEYTSTTSSYSNNQSQEQGPLRPHSDKCDEDESSSTMQDEVDEDEEDDANEDEEDDSDEDDEEEVEEDDDDDDQDNLYEEELLSLLERFEQVEHPVCEWKLEGDDACIACRFQLYQKNCVQALQDDELCITDIADAMAIIGVFAPFLQTQRMRATFNKKILTQLAVPLPLPDPGIDDAAVLKAVRLRINNKFEDASKELWGIDRKLRLMFENLLESLPEKVDRSISEVTFTVNYVAPVLNSILKIDGKTNVQYPNTDSHVQKDQGLKPDRPDIVVKSNGHEILYGEITGPCRANCRSKTDWDVFRLVRFGKSFLDSGNDTVPLLQVVHDSGTVMRLSLKQRGIYILERIGLFNVPCSVGTIPALLGTLPPLLVPMEDVNKLAEYEFDMNRKRRSWRFDDIVTRKKIK